jgi:hypothetical protein
MVVLARRTRGSSIIKSCLGTETRARQLSDTKTMSMQHRIAFHIDRITRGLRQVVRLGEGRESGEMVHGQAIGNTSVSLGGEGDRTFSSSISIFLFHYSSFLTCYE